MARRLPDDIGAAVEGLNDHDGRAVSRYLTGQPSHWPEATALALDLAEHAEVRGQFFNRTADEVGHEFAATAGEKLGQALHSAVQFAADPAGKSHLAEALKRNHPSDPEWASHINSALKKSLNRAQARNLSGHFRSFSERYPLEFSNARDLAEAATQWNVTVEAVVGAFLLRTWWDYAVIAWAISEEDTQRGMAPADADIGDTQGPTDRDSPPLGPRGAPGSRPRDLATAFVEATLEHSVLIADDIGEQQRFLVDPPGPNVAAEERGNEIASRLAWLIAPDEIPDGERVVELLLEVNQERYFARITLDATVGPVTVRFDDESIARFQLTSDIEDRSQVGTDLASDLATAFKSAAMTDLVTIVDDTGNRDLLGGAELASGMSEDDREDELATLLRWWVSRKTDIPHPGWIDARVEVSRLALDVGVAVEQDAGPVRVQFGDGSIATFLNQQEPMDSVAVGSALDSPSDEQGTDEEPTTDAPLDDGADPGAVEVFSDGLDFELVEQLSEDDSLALWRELELLRSELQRIFAEGVLPPEAEDRARGQLTALESELHRVGGALGGAARSYILALNHTLAAARDLAKAAADLVDQSPRAQVFMDLITAAGELAGSPLEAARLGPPLDTIAELAWLAASTSNEPPQRSEVNAELDRRIGVGPGRRISDNIEFLSAGLKDQKSLIAAGTVATGAITALLEIDVLTDPQLLAATGAFGALISSMLAMTHFAYRVSRGLKPHPTRDLPTETS